jgi:formylglycine-generating enzyme required for sulfatase activity
MKKTSGIIALFSVALVAVSVIIWLLLPRPEIAFGILTPENNLQDQAKVFYGTELKLKWQVQHATKTQLIIHPNSMLVDNSGIKKLLIEKPVTITLTATDYYLFNLPVNFFSFTEEKTIKINLLPPKVTCISLDGECLVQDHHDPDNPMKASQEICYGNEKTLSWKVEGAKSVTSHFQGSQPTNTEQPVTLRVDTPTTFTLTATNGIDTVVSELALPLAPPKIECLSVNGQCVESAQLNDLCFGDTLDIRVDGSCYKSLTSQVQTDELKTDDGTPFTLKPEKPTQLTVIATNGIEEVKKDFAINFEQPVIDTFCGPGKMVTLGSEHPFNWKTRCSAKVTLKSIPANQDGSIITSTDAKGETSLGIESTRYELTAYNHLGENPQIDQQIMDIKVAPTGLIPIKLSSDSDISFLIQRHEVTQKEYQECDTCEQLPGNEAYNNLYCIHSVDWENHLLLGQQGDHVQAVACLNKPQALDLLDYLGEKWHYSPPLPDTIIQTDATWECDIQMGKEMATGLPGGALQLSDRPISCINWKEAALYANWKSRQENLTPCYDSVPSHIPDCQGYRLPSRKEWQVVAIGQNNLTWYPWGNKSLTCKMIGLQADCDNPKPLAVGSVSQDISQLGVHDMGLGVREWTGDLKFRKDSAWVRGMDYTKRWTSLVTWLKRFDTQRDAQSHSLNSRNSTIGFRLVRPIPTQSSQTKHCISGHTSF